MSLKVSYDPKFDLLYVAEDALQEEVVEVYPCVYLGLNSAGALVAMEIFPAEKVLGDVIYPLRGGSHFKRIRLNGSLSDLDAQLRPADGSEYLDYMEAWPEKEVNDPDAVKTLETLRRGINAIFEQMKGRDFLQPAED